MTIHAPAHPSGVTTPRVHHHYLAWVVVATAVVLALGAALILPSATPVAKVPSEAQRLVEFRAAERADWNASMAQLNILPVTPALSEAQRLVEFRAAERADWNASMEQLKTRLEP